jgi:hypothetical protein
MEYVAGHSLNRPMRSSVVIVASDAMTEEAERLRLHAVIISTPPESYRPSTLEVSYALSQQLHVPRYSIRVSSLKPGVFLADFKICQERDRALCKQFIEIGGTMLPIRPWRSAGGATECTWWYHVKVVMEDVPLEAWNEDGVKVILGDTCINIIDRLRQQIDGPRPGVL